MNGDEASSDESHVAEPFVDEQGKQSAKSVIKNQVCVFPHMSARVGFMVMITNDDKHDEW